MAADVPTNLGVVLRRYRLLGEMQQRDLARLIGISAATLCRMERGHTPDAVTLLKLWTWFLKNGSPR